MGRRALPLVRAVADGRRECAHLGTDLVDRFGIVLEPGADQPMYAATAHRLYSVDARAPSAQAATLVAETSREAHAYQRAVLTGVCASQLPSMVAVASTDRVAYYDPRFPDEPVHSWTHYRGHDRTLSLGAVRVHDDEVLCLGSQRNMLTTTYTARADPHTYIAAQPPGMVRSAAPPRPAGAIAPTPAYWATLAAWAPSMGQEVWHMEQAPTGDLWLQRYAPAGEAGAHEAPCAPAAPLQRRVQDSADAAWHDAGPFGAREATHLDFRAVYRGTSTVSRQR